METTKNTTPSNFKFGANVTWPLRVKGVTKTMKGKIAGIAAPEKTLAATKFSGMKIATASKDGKKYLVKKGSNHFLVNPKQLSIV